jgi:hypothetical protein
MNNKVKISIDEMEWKELDAAKRHRIIELMSETGLSVKGLEELEKEIGEQTIQDIYKQFYEDEE